MFFGGVLCCAWLFKSDYLFWDGHCMVFHWGAVNFFVDSQNYNSKMARFGGPLAGT